MAMVNVRVELYECRSGRRCHGMLRKKLILSGLVGALGLSMIAVAASAQQIGKPEVISSKGSCTGAVIANVLTSCMPNASATHLQTPHNEISFIFQLENGDAIVFVGLVEARPQPGRYELYLSSLLQRRSSTYSTTRIKGRCVLSLTANNSTWRDIDCSGLDEKAFLYSVKWNSDGSPVNVRALDDKSLPPASVNQQVPATTISEVSARFKQVFSTTGIQGVSRDIQNCFDDAKSAMKTKSCMLYDISAVRFNKSVIEQFVSRGATNIPSNPYLEDRAFEARMKIYSRLVFGGSQDAALAYFGDAPNTVNMGLVKK